MTKATTQSDEQKIPKLRFSGFSGAWVDRKLGEIAEITSSKRVYLSDYVDVGIPFFRGKEISELKKSKTASDILYIKESKFNEFKRKFGAPQNGDILITSVGTLGNIYRVNLDYEFYFKDGNLIWLKNPNVNSSFLEMIIDHHKRDLLKGVIGSTQKALTIIGIKKVEIPFPPSAPEQQKITSFLGAVDEYIESLKSQKEKLEAYKKGIMQKIFNQEIRFKDDNGNDFSEWEEKKLGEMEIYISDGNYGEMYPKASEMKNSGIPFIRANNIKELKVVWNDMKYISEELHSVLTSGHLESGDILVTTRGNIGMLALVTDEFENSNINAQICLLRPSKNLSSRYILNYLASKNGKKQFKELQTGTALKQLPKGNLAKIKVPIPYLPEQQKVADFLTSLDNLIEAKQEQVIKVEEWKKGLMQQLFI